jgi:hypothetical protein
MDTSAERILSKRMYALRGDGYMVYMYYGIQGEGIRAKG